MIRSCLSLFAVFFFGVAHAEPQQLHLSRPGETAPVTLPLPAGATIVACGGEALLNFYCLRTPEAQESQILSELSAGIRAHGYKTLGEDTTNRPITSIFERPQPGVACPLLVMITSDTKTQPGRPPLAPGTIEIQLAKTADIRCFFD